MLSILKVFNKKNNSYSKIVTKKLYFVILSAVIVRRAIIKNG